MKLLGFLLIAATLAMPAAGGAATDPPRIVPWHMIGNAGLGMSRDRIEYSYGVRAAAVKSVLYTVDGGVLQISYDPAGRVDFISTTAPRYRTKGGIGVGVAVPRGQCHRTATGKCQFWWRGFRYRGGGTWQRDGQRRGGRSVIVGLVTRLGVITEVHMFFTPNES